MRAAGDKLEKPCNSNHHGLRVGCYGAIYTRLEHDPLCQTCTARSILSEHDHLHLGREVCTTLGISGKPGETVKCKCGSFHH